MAEDEQDLKGPGGVGPSLALKAAVMQALNFYLYDDAIFLAERLYTEGSQSEGGDDEGSLSAFG